jgi:hypothetical protein
MRARPTIFAVLNARRNSKDEKPSSLNNRN